MLLFADISTENTDFCVYVMQRVKSDELNGRMNEIWIGTETMIRNRNFVWTKCLMVVMQLKLGLNSTYTRLEGEKKKYGSSIYEFIILDLFSRNLHTCYISMNESFRTRSFLFMIYFYSFSFFLSFFYIGMNLLES